MEQPLQDLKDEYEAKRLALLDSLKTIYDSWIATNRPEDYDYLLAYYVNNIETQNDSFLTNQETSFITKVSTLLDIPM